MSCLIDVSMERLDRIQQIFHTMNRSSKTESKMLATEWLDKHKRTFSSFKNGSFLEIETENSNPCFSKVLDSFSGEELAQVHIISVEDVYPELKKDKHSSFDAIKMSKCIYRIGRNLEDNLQLFSEVESLTTGKHFHKARYVDVPNLIQTFYESSQKSLNCSDKYKDTSVIIIAEEYNNPLLSLSWKISSFLAVGTSVLLCVKAQFCLSALLLCEICNESGLPPMALDVFVFDDYESLPKSWISSRSDAIYMFPYLLPQKKTSVIIYDDADLHGAANSILEILAFNDTRVQNSGCKVLYQESIEEEFLKLLKERLEKVSIGTNFSKTDLSCLITEDQKHQIDSIVSEERNLKNEVFVAPSPDNLAYTHYKPILLCNPRSTFKRKNQVGGPIVVASCFRTTKESIAIFNQENQCSSVSIWTEKLSVAFEVASKLKTETVWLNSQNIFGLHTVMELNNFFNVYDLNKYVIVNNAILSSHHGSDIPSSSNEKPKYIHQFEIDSYGTNIGSGEVFIGGVIKPSADKALMECLGPKGPYYVAGGSVADIQTAVSSAANAQPKWETLAKGKRTQILISILDNLLKKREEFVSNLQESAISLLEARTEVDQAIKLIRKFVKFVDHFSDSLLVKESNLQVCNNYIPLGVIGIECPDENPLLSFLHYVLPAICFGNAVVVIPSEKFPVPDLKMCQVFKDSGLPPGVINVISGNRAHLTQLLLSSEVNAVWLNDASSSFCSLDSKRIFSVCFDMKTCLESPITEFLGRSTYKKTIYLPFGDIFAN